MKPSLAQRTASMAVDFPAPFGPRKRYTPGPSRGISASLSARKFRIRMRLSNIGYLLSPITWINSSDWPQRDRGQAPPERIGWPAHNHGSRPTLNVPGVVERRGSVDGLSQL